MLKLIAISKYEEIKCDCALSITHQQIEFCYKGTYHTIKYKETRKGNYFLLKGIRYYFKRTGCKGCPFALDLQKQLLVMKKLLPNEYKQCLILWKPVYDEYVRLGYRLSKDFYDIKPQYTIEDYLGEE